MKFGIISCCYNVEEFIQKHIDSVWSQKGCEFIHYIVDDGSTDKTAEILRKEGERLGVNFIILTKPYNTGGVHSWIQAMEGVPLEDEDVVVELDGDDYFLHDKVLLRIKEEYDKGYLATYGNYKVIGEDVASVCRPKYIQLPVRHQLASTEIGEKAFPYSAVRTYKRKFFNEIPVWHFLDWDGRLFSSAKDLVHFVPILELVGLENISYIEDELLGYTQHSNNDHATPKGIEDQQRCHANLLYKAPLAQSPQAK